MAECIAADAVSSASSCGCAGGCRGCTILLGRAGRKAVRQQFSTMLLYLRFFICWCVLYTADVTVDRLVRRSNDLALGHILLPKDPGDTDPYLAAGIILTVTGIIAGLVLAIIYAVASTLMNSIPQLKKWSPYFKSILISTAIGFLIYQVWNGYTHEIVFAYKGAGVGFVSGLISGWLTVRKSQYVLQER